jgi:sulfatase modifying factor 1
MAHLREKSNDGQSFASDPACNEGITDRGEHPMNCVSADQASAFCRAQDKRLPTEEEWEWAARAEDRVPPWGNKVRNFPWGNDLPASQLCWSRPLPRDGTCKVGSFPDGDTPDGIHDLAGNVQEWTSSSAEGGYRVYRGSSWRGKYATDLYVAGRLWASPQARGAWLGFRCAK